ncbi:GNAT family N-acetyltransferase [Bosea sp. (in: a-proteobacteria)]|uniref:GNAT family N-acetyltransferase n=1 Tax=Bosea sp. (in: a-proteobacteria) TaxID=1871050 RepID=UPI002FC6D77E
MARADRAVTLRPVAAGDLDACHRLSMQVSWPHRREDWEFVLDLGQGFVAVVAEEVVGTALWWPFGAGHASLGSIIVAPDRQGAGIGRLLMSGLLDATEGRSLALVATQQGQPLYARYGFAPGGTVLQHQDTGPDVAAPILARGESLRPAIAGDLPLLASLDSAATGLPRQAVLAALLARAEAVVLERGGVAAGFGFLRRHGRGWLLGPVAAADAQAARTVIAHWLSAKRGEFVRIDVHAHTGLGAWLTGIGLPQVASGLVMLRGVVQAAPGPTRQFALASQALG